MVEKYINKFSLLHIHMSKGVYSLLRNKKGALELSITAIVVLIIAITVLGFAIFFIKQLFGGGTEIFTKQFEQVKQQLRDEFAERGSTLAFDIGSNLQAKRGKNLDFFVGIANTENEKTCYGLEVFCDSPFSSDACDEKTPPVKVAGKDPDLKWFPTFPKQVLINPNDVYVAPVSLLLTTAAKDTYRMTLNMYKAKSCDALDYSETQLVETQQFHIQLS